MSGTGILYLLVAVQAIAILYLGGALGTELNIGISKPYRVRLIAWIAVGYAIGTLVTTIVYNTTSGIP
jgi:hypothetical protein